MKRARRNRQRPEPSSREAVEQGAREYLAELVRHFPELSSRDWEILEGLLGLWCEIGPDKILGNMSLVAESLGWALYKEKRPTLEREQCTALAHKLEKWSHQAEELAPR